MNRLIIIVLLFNLSACMRPIIHKNIAVNEKKHSQFGRIPERDFYYSTKIGDSLNIAWEAKASGGFAPTSPTVYDKFLFLPDLSGRVYSFDLQNGKNYGVEKRKGAVSTAVMTYRSRLIYIMNELKEKYSSLVYYDYFLPEIIEEHRIYGTFENEPIITDSAYYYINNLGIVYKFNFVGEIEWEIETGVIVKSAPAIKDNKMFVANLAGEIIVINIHNGKIIYREYYSDGFESGLTIAEEALLLGDNNGIVYSISVNNYSVNWKRHTGAKIKSTVVHNGPELFIGNLAGKVFSLDKFTGKVNWKIDTRGVVNTTPLLFDDFLVQPNQNKKLDFINRENGNIEKSFEYNYRLTLSPLYYNGLLVVGNAYGEIYAYRKADIK